MKNALNKCWQACFLVVQSRLSESVEFKNNANVDLFLSVFADFYLIGSNERT